MGTFQETLAEGNEGALHLGPERARVYFDLSPEDKDRFTKLINDMRNIKMTMPIMQLNSKFVNNMLPKWGIFVIVVKLNRGLRDSNYDQLYAYLKQHEEHVNENKMMLERFTQHNVDPLSLMSNVSHQQYYSQSSTTPPSTHGRQNRGQGNNARGTGAAGYGGAQNRVGNANLGQARQIKCYNCNAQDNEVALDEEQLLFITGGQDNAVDEDMGEQPVQDLALNVDNVFQADDCDAFDSDVDEAPTAQTMFMANLSSVDHVYDESSPLYDSDILSEAAQSVFARAKFELTEREQKIEEQLRIVITDHNIKEENLKKKLHSVNMQLNSTINHSKSMAAEVTSLKMEFKQKENKYLEEILDMKALKEMDVLKMKAEALKEQTPASRPIKALTVYPPNTPATLVPRYDEIERKNLLIENDNLITDCLSKELFYIATNSELTVSRFTKMLDAHTVVQARCLLNEKIQMDDHKESFGNNTSLPALDAYDFDSVFVIEKMKASIQGKANAIKKLRMQISQLKEICSEADRTLDFRALDF
ncbi:hypothetical protein Tco_0444750 [Tanacetum coccineum]